MVKSRSVNMVIGKNSQFQRDVAPKTTTPAKTDLTLEQALKSYKFIQYFF